MKKLIAWLAASNRYKHLTGGAAIAAVAVALAMVTGAPALSAAAGALFAATVAAGCLEFKDRAHGCRWDWVDFAMTVAGGAGVAGLTIAVF